MNENLNALGKHVCVSIMRLSNGQMQVMLGTLDDGEFDPAGSLGCLPAHEVPDPPVTSVSGALRLIAHTLERAEATERTYQVEINRHRVSYYAAECTNAEPHECDDTCRWLDGDRREIEPVDTDMRTYDAEDAEDYCSPIAWALDQLRYLPHLEPSTSPVGTYASEDEWLSGSSENPYAGAGEDVEEYSVYLRGDWTPEQRAEVFRRA